MTKTNTADVLRLQRENEGLREIVAHAIGILVTLASQDIQLIDPRYTAEEAKKELIQQVNALDNSAKTAAPQ